MPTEEWVNGVAFHGDSVSAGGPGGVGGGGGGGQEDGGAPRTRVVRLASRALPAALALARPLVALPRGGAAVVGRLTMHVLRATTLAAADSRCAARAAVVAGRSGAGGDEWTAAFEDDTAAAVAVRAGSGRRRVRAAAPI